METNDIKVKFVDLLLLSSLGLSLTTGCRQDDRLVGLEKEVVQDPTTATVTIKGYCARDNYEYVEMWATPASYIIESDEIKPDFDRDGLPNYRDDSEDMGLNRYQSDSNFDGYHDLVIYQAGYDLRSQKALKPCDNPNQDTDLDGLTDCEEENLTHTDPKMWDTDDDRIPDFIEIRHGLNPRDASDAAYNVAGDGISNIDKIKVALPVSEVATDATEKLALHYKISQLDSGKCYDFEISNIAYADVSNGNILQLSFFERGNDGRNSLRPLALLLESLAEKSPGQFEYQYEQTGDAGWAVQGVIP